MPFEGLKIQDLRPGDLVIGRPTFNEHIITTQFIVSITPAKRRMRVWITFVMQSSWKNGIFSVVYPKHKLLSDVFFSNSILVRRGEDV